MEFDLGKIDENFIENNKELFLRPINPDNMEWLEPLKKSEKGDNT